MAHLILYTIITLAFAKGYPAGNVVQEPQEGIFQRSFGRERAILENENKVSQLDSVYDQVLHYSATSKGIQPLVDTISEDEKYGNDGGLSRQIGKGISDGVQGLSNLANNIIDAPFNKANALSREATQRLNNLGAYLVGL